MTARLLYKNYFSFYPTFKLWFSTNNLPAVRGTDEGIWRRIRRIPFDYRIPDNERVQDFGRTFDEELPGILNWAVKGAVDWNENGLIIPDEVRAATKTYRAEMDVVGAFIEECCTEAQSLSARSSELYKAYVAWCTENGEFHVSNKAFSQAIRAKGFEKKTMKYGAIWLGIDVSHQREMDYSEKGERDDG